MPWYADAAPRRIRQVVGDVGAVVGVVLAVVIGVAVHRSIAAIAAIGARVQRDGSAFQGRLSDAADAVGKLPFGGDTIAAPLRAAGRSAGGITQAGADQQTATLRVALLVGVLLTVVLLALVVAVWTGTRARGIRAARRAVRLAGSTGGVEVLALRALHREDVLALGRDVVARWRSGDPEVVRALADRELRRLGLDPRRRAAS